MAYIPSSLILRTVIATPLHHIPIPSFTDRALVLYVMPGIKRKANPPPPRASTSKIQRQPARKQLRPASPSDDDGDSDFDDAADLMAAATTSANGMAAFDDAYSGSSSEGSEEDQPALTMMSDEDMEGGFEDLEGEEGELNDGQYEDSDGDEDDFEDLEAGAGEMGKTTKRQGAKSKEALYAPPTNEEMQGLRETGELFKSNVIKLQVSKTPARRPEAPG